MSDKQAAEAAAVPKSSKKKFIVIGIVAAAVVAAGGGGGWWYMHRPAAAHGEHAKEEAEAGGVVPLEPFLVNLADTGGSRYLRTTLKLVVPDEKSAEKLTKNQVALTRTRSAILELLTTETAEALVTPDGKTRLKKTICERVSPLVGLQVADVLFVDFVVQF
jgi:flagellar FliL protein